MKSNFVTLLLGCLLIPLVLVPAIEVSGQTPQHIYTGTGSTIGNVSPFGTTGNTRKMWIFSPSNFSPAAPTGYITAIYFKVGATPASSTFTNLLVRMGSTTLSTFVAGPYPSNIDTVFFAASHTVSIIASGPWLKITLQTPFYFNGVSNFLVDAQQGGYTSGITIYQQTVTGKCLYGPASTSTGSVADRLVEFGFDMIPGGTDAGLEAFVALPDTVCAGSLPVTVALKNYGPNQLSGATINWTVNTVAKPAFTWTGNLAVNATTNVTIGSHNFIQGVTSSVKAWVSNPNGVADTVHANDTVFKPEIFALPAPQVNLNDTLLVICQGDSAMINGLLTGTPPWSVVINDGATNISYSNMNSPAFSIFVNPAANTTYTFVTIADATGCVNTSGAKVDVNVQPAPSATITPVGTTAACQGDSVSLMASIGLNFTYQWYRNNVAITGETGYVMHAKTGGDFTVKVTSPYGCSNLSSPVTVVIHPLPVVFLGNDTNVAPGAAVMLDAGSGYTSYIWSTGAITQTIIVDTAGQGTGIQTIWVVVRDNNYCEGGDTIHINFINNPGISEILSGFGLQIAPNPTTGRFEMQIQGLPPGELSFHIFNTKGRLVCQRSFMYHPDRNIVGIDAGTLPDGLYLLRLNDHNGRVVGAARLIIRQ